MGFTLPQMRAIRSTADGVHVVDADRPDGGGVRVTVTHAGICGTDVALVASGRGLDVIPGHEIAGVLDDGTRVVIEPLDPCGSCPPCSAGAYNVCVEDSWFGGTRDGGMAEELVVPERCLVPIPDELPLADACLAEPLAVALHGLRRANAQPGERVGIVGAGSIGLLAAAAALDLGCSVSVEARYESQREMAARLGATVAEPQEGLDLVVAAAGGSSGVEHAANLARPRGRVLVLTEPYDAFMPASAAFREVNAVTSLAYAGNGRRDIEDAVGMLTRTPALADLITHRYPLEQAVEAFRVAADRSGGSIKVVLEPPSPAGHAL
jgi:threonine dehydrogenase-like Zn-dependent dehydrogenase